MKENTSKKVTRANSNVKIILRKDSEGKMLTFWRQRQDESFHVRAKPRRLDRQLQNAYWNKNFLPIAVAVVK